MTQVINEALSAVLQVGIFTLLPFIVYLIQYKKAKGFSNYIGLVKTTSAAAMLSVATALLFLGGTLIVFLLSDNIRSAMITPPSITGKLREMGLSATSISTLIIIAVFKTSLAEEIFFRGFIAKRFISWLGYSKGNLAQSILFAALHVALFAAMTNAEPVFLLFIFFLPGLGAYFIGYIMEKKGNGSILPGWIAHGAGNLISYFIIAFVL